MFSSDYNGFLQIYTVWKLPGVFTNTGNVPASIRIAPFSNDSTPDEMDQSATIEPGRKMTIGNEKWPKGYGLVVEIDGNNTVAESCKFLQASNGRRSI